MNSGRTKGEIRSESLKKRDALNPDEKAGKDLAIKGNFLSLPEYKNASTVLFFASFRSEVNTIPLIIKALEDGKRILLPKVNKASGELDIYEIESLNEIQKGYMGIPEPAGGIPAAPPVNCDICDIIVIPGAVFDLKGGRLGYGGGYYDRLLSQLKGERKPHLIALAYELQILEQPLPLEGHDVKVEKIVTEKRVIDCHG